jgi:hypothetical protein
MERRHKQLAQRKSARAMRALSTPAMDHRCPAELALYPGREALEHKGGILKPAELFLEPAKRSGSAHGAFFSHHLKGQLTL